MAVKAAWTAGFNSGYDLSPLIVPAADRHDHDEWIEGHLAGRDTRRMVRFISTIAVEGFRYVHDDDALPAEGPTVSYLDGDEATAEAEIERGMAESMEGEL